MKTCTKCGETKPLDEFYPRSDRPGHRRPECRSCGMRRKMRWEAANPEKSDAIARRYRASHPNEIAERKARWASAHPGAMQQHRAAWDALNAGRLAPARQAWARVRYAKQTGALQPPDSCEDCGVGGLPLDAAHSDYSCPLDVRWLCRPCHVKWDKAQPKTKAAGDTAERVA